MALRQQRHSLHAGVALRWVRLAPALTVVQPETFKRWRRQGGHVDGARSARTLPHPPGTTYEDTPMGRVSQPTDMVQ
jgi:hypothetical protein